VTYDAIHPHLEISKRLSAIYGLHHKDNDFRLERSPYNDLLEKLGNPHLNLPPTIHIAGTNGKGSTLAFLKSIYEQAGYTVHAYTSPHLLTFNERIYLAGEDISDETLLHYLKMVDAANQNNGVTFFEYTTALAFKAMADASADICLLETGLGGRLDCTNIIQKPVATVITAIGYDHMDFLGVTITDIAREKAGIIKPNAPCIIAPQPYHEVLSVFDTKAEDVGAIILHAERQDNLPPLGLVGEHQKDNASTALKTIDSLQKQFPVSKQGVETGLQNAKWRARMEKITKGAIYDLLPQGSELWFDCGHNADGAKAISEQLKLWKRAKPDRPIHLILGLGSDKDPNAFLKSITPYIDSLTCVDLMNARNPQKAEDLAKKITVLNDMQTKKSLLESIDYSNNTESITLVAGSLYLYREMVT
jgi:dihydrofolate synthase/folylpolyglutamate synthase